MAIRLDSSKRETLRRLIVATLMGSLLHAVACSIKRPFEFGNGSRIHTFISAGVSGVMTFPIVLAALLLPLRTGVRHFWPRATQRAHGIVAAVALLALVGIWIGVRFVSGIVLPAYCHGYFWHSAFWVSFVIAVVASFCWPLANEPWPASAVERDA
jgi:MFS family permease